MNELSKNEIKLLLSILPEQKSGYKIYRDMISTMKVMGKGRFENGNFYIGTGAAKPDLSIPSSPVFAVGIVKTNIGSIDVLIHEYEDDLIEVQLSKRVCDVEEVIINSVLSFSEWNLGGNSPGSTEVVKEFEIIKDKLILVIDKTNKKIWFHNYESGVNHIIPVSNYFNELMRLKKIKDENLFRSPSLFFNKLDDFTDEEFKLAFYQYNKFMRRFDIKINPEDLLTPVVKKKKFLKLFSRG
jgi:hypothetical protein